MEYNRKTQRTEIQSQVNRFFRRHIDISPRAMAALQGRWCEEGPEFGYPYFIPALSVFEGLLASSPSCLALLFEAGIPVEKLFSSGEQEGPGFVPRQTLDWIFRGHRENYEWKTHKMKLKICSSASAVLKKRSLTELDLLSAFLQTAYTGPLTFSEKVDYGLLSKYLTGVGACLLEACSLDAEKVIEKGEEWNGETDSYRARSVAAQCLKYLPDKIKKIEIADPSHDRFQFALWLDTEGSVRIRPFGVGSLGSLEPSYLKTDQRYVFREGIFQPVSSIFPGFSKDVILELEEMLNSKVCSEQDFQGFFERYPEFLMGLDYKQIHPQLVLYNDDGPNFIPDFMLEPMPSEFCDVLELKLPYQPLLRRLRKKSRVHFRAVISEAVSQLMEYRRYFESKQHRKEFHARFGLKAYHPKMILVAGRKHDFKSDFERQELRCLLPKDLEIWTYDDVLARAKKYQECIVKV